MKLYTYTGYQSHDLMCGMLQTIVCNLKITAVVVGRQTPRAAVLGQAALSCHVVALLQLVLHLLLQQNEPRSTEEKSNFRKGNTTRERGALLNESRKDLSLMRAPAVNKPQPLSI